MTTPYLDKPLRTVADAKRQIHMERLKDISEGYRQQQLRCENGSDTSWRDGNRPRQLAEAVEWAEEQCDFNTFLLDALRYARRFLKPEDHDTAYVDAVIAKAKDQPND